jgi:hypothetical protein
MASNIESSAPEIYLGGIISIGLVKGIHLVQGHGTGVYATDRRIIVNGGLKGSRVANALVAHFVDRFSTTIILDNTKVDNEKALRELEENKEFEISKANILRIELKKWNTWKAGYLKICALDGVETKVMTNNHLHNEGYEYLRGLMQTACPNALSVQD